MKLFEKINGHIISKYLDNLVLFENEQPPYFITCRDINLARKQ